MSGLKSDDINPFVDPYVALSQSAGNNTSATTAYQAPPPPYTNQPPEYTSAMPPPIQPTVQPNASGYQQLPFSELPAVAPQGISPMYPPPSSQMSTYSHAPQLNQMELQKRTNELEAREQELNQRQQMALRENNFPPMPSFCPWKPCYYHAIDIDIPVRSQKSCKIMFYLWQFYVVTLLVNFISSFALLVGGSGDGDSGGTTFGVSLIYMFAFTPCSFVLWYRPIYKALRDDSSFNYMVFFFIFFFQICWCCLAALGIPSFGTVGWINGLAQTARGASGAGALMIITGIMWTVLAVFMILFYKKIHATYRSSGASFEKAQGELAAGIVSNKTMQNVAVETMKAGIASGTQPQR